MPAGHRSIELTLSGKRTQTPSKVAFVLDIYNKKKMTKTDANHLQARLREGAKTYCHNAIAPEHVEKAWNTSTQLIELRIRSARGSPLSIGFALVQKKGKTLFIHLLCAATSERTSERAQLTKLPISPGTILLDQIEELATAAGVLDIQLSAVPYVINYYRNKGFRHLYPGESTERPTIAAAAKTIAQHRFKTNDEVDRVLKIGEAAIDADKLPDKLPASTKAKTIAEQLSWFLPEYEFKHTPEGTIVALDNRGRIDQAITTALANRSEHAATLDAFMQLHKAGFATDDPTQPLNEAPQWDRAREDVDVDSDDTFLMTKRIGQGKRTSHKTRKAHHARNHLNPHKSKTKSNSKSKLKNKDTKTSRHSTRKNRQH